MRIEYQVKEDAVAYGKLHLPESDIYGKDYRALPPTEHMILVAWYETAAQLELACFQNGFVYVRLGRRAGALHVHPNLAKVRHILLRTYRSQVACGLLVLREPGFQVFTRKQLRAELAARAHRAGVAAWESSVGQDDEEFIYALFPTQPDASWEGCDWNGDKVMELIEAFETDARNKLVENVGRQSPYPRILPLRDLLMARH